MLPSMLPPSPALQHTLHVLLEHLLLPLRGGECPQESLDGQAVSDLKDLLAFLAEDRAGKVVAARVLRAGAVQEISVKVGVRA